MASPGFATRYVRNLVCTWELRVPEGRRILLQPIVQDVEGSMATADGLGKTDTFFGSKTIQYTPINHRSS